MAATLQWDPSVSDAEHSAADGYVVRFYDVLAPAAVYSFQVQGPDTTQVPGIESALHLTPGASYRFTVSAYNAAGESPPTPEVAYTYAWEPFVPPGNTLPPEVQHVLISLPPGTLTILP